METMRYIPPLTWVTWEFNTETHSRDANNCVTEMFKAYLEAAEFFDKPEEEDWSDAEFSAEAKDFAWFECCMFLQLAKWHIKDWTMEQIGHDLWLTRNGHGAGFWDRDFGTKESRDKLTEVSKTMGERDIYLGDDGLIYFS